MNTGTCAVVWGLALASMAGCHKTESATDDAGVFAASAAPVDAVEAVDGSGPRVGAVGPDVVEPVPALVPADPAIPLHEAVVGAAPIPADNAAPLAPPAPVAEEQPAQPEAGDTWIPGYWWWSPPLARYVWVGGAWRHPPPNQTWTPGSWTPVGAQFVWSPGYWGPQGYAQVPIDVAPPPLQVEVAGPAPGVGFVWTPGYYGYRDGGYVWTGGVWGRPPMAGVGWVAPRYVGIGRRFYLQPGRWDFPAERRGVAYRPDINVRAGEHLRLSPVPAGVMVAHANYTSSCAHAISMGAVRMPGGGFALPHGAGERAIDRGPHEVEAHGGFEQKAKMEGPHEAPHEMPHEAQHENRGPAGAPQQHMENRQQPQHAAPAEHQGGPSFQHAAGGGKRR